MRLRQVKLGGKYYSRSAGACDDSKPSVALEIVTVQYSFGGSYRAVRIERPDGEIADVLPDFLTPWDEHLREERIFADRLDELSTVADSLSEVLRGEVEIEDYLREEAFVKLSEAAADNLLEILSARPLPASCRINCMREGEAKTAARAKAGARIRRALGMGKAGRFPASQLEGDQAACLLCSDDDLQKLSVRLGAAAEPVSALPDLI